MNNYATVTFSNHNMIVTPVTVAGTPTGPANDLFLGQKVQVTITSSKTPNFDWAAHVGFPVQGGAAFPAYAPIRTQWEVNLSMSGKVLITLPMGRITNVGAWVNTQAGAELARAAIAAATP